MNELTDDQLDGLFRKSAEEFDPPFDAAAWQAMQGQLDDLDRSDSVWRKRLINWSLPLLFLFLLTGVDWYRQQEDSATVLQPTAIQVAKKHAVTYRLSSMAAQESRLGDRATTGPNAPVSNHDKTRTGPSTTELNWQRQPAQTASKQVMPLSDKPVRRQPGPEIRPEQVLPIALMSDKKSSVVVVQPRSLTGTPFASPNPDWTPDTTTAETGPAVPATDAPAVLPESDQLHLLAIRPGQWPSSFPLANRPVAAEPETIPHQPLTATPEHQHGLSVRLVIAPDLSAVGLRNFARPGTNVGVLLEYRLAPRWSIQAGVLRSTKVYNAQLSDYTWIGKRWAVMPDGVDGRCVMLDIPLNLRYDFVLRPRSEGRQPDRWFVSGGVTTYVILNEEYTYNYAWPDDPAIKYRNWRVDATSRYGFSQLNLSAGYERSFSRRLSWQIEPFIKVPLKGVGFYKIDLLSTGAFLSLRYKF